jgi:chromosome segregation ATPase
MSQIPKDLKSKYNHDNKFLWVDSQLEKLMTKQKELEDEIVNLTGKIKNDMDYIKMLEGSVSDLKKDLETCTKHHSRLYDDYSELKKERDLLKEEIELLVKGFE